MGSLRELLKTKKIEQENKYLLPEKWKMPIEGSIIPLSDLSDKAFGKGMMGAGFAIKANESTVYSPINGRVASIFPGGHAIAMVSDNGTEILIHVGIDSVGLKGEGFNLKVEKGADIKIGEPLVDVDFKLLESKLVDSSVIIVFTDIDEGTIYIDDNKPVWKK